MRVKIVAYLALSVASLRTELCAAYPSAGDFAGLTPTDIAVNWNGVNTLLVTTIPLPGGEDRLKAEVERIIQPYRKPAPIKVPVPLKQLIASNRRVPTPVASRKMALG